MPKLQMKEALAAWDEASEAYKAAAFLSLPPASAAAARRRLEESGVKRKSVFDWLLFWYAGPPPD
eukprot:3729417-Rhodomonas_salina.2